MTEERVTCFGYPYIGWQDDKITQLYSCPNPAKYEVGGNHYCGVHRRQAERQVKRLAGQLAKLKREALQQDVYQFVRDVAGAEIPLYEIEVRSEELVKRMDETT